LLGANGRQRPPIIIDPTPRHPISGARPPEQHAPPLLVGTHPGGGSPAQRRPLLVHQPPAHSTRLVVASTRVVASPRPSRELAAPARREAQPPWGVSTLHLAVLALGPHSTRSGYPTSAQYPHCTVSYTYGRPRSSRGLSSASSSRFVGAAAAPLASASGASPISTGSSS